MIPFIHLGRLHIGQLIDRSIDIPTFGLMLWAAFLAAYFVLNAEFMRRKVQADAQSVLLLIAVAGIVGSKLWHVLETPSLLFAHPLNLIFDKTGFAWFGGFSLGAITMW